MHKDYWRERHVSLAWEKTSPLAEQKSEKKAASSRKKKQQPPTIALLTAEMTLRDAPGPVRDFVTASLSSLCFSCLACILD